MAGTVKTAPRELDAVWLLAFPTYWAVVAGYGVFAVVEPIVSVKQSYGDMNAQTLGALIAATAAIALLGTLAAARGRTDLPEAFAILLFLAVMVYYFSAVYQAAYVAGGPPTRAGSAFVPLVFAVFPFFRLLVIVRAHVYRPRART